VGREGGKPPTKGIFLDEGSVGQRLDASV